MSLAHQWRGEGSRTVTILGITCLYALPLGDFYFNMPMDQEINDEYWVASVSGVVLRPQTGLKLST